MNAAVTVQKSAHRILLYSLRGAEQELPLFITDQRDFSPLLRGSLSACPPGQSGPDNCLAFTESTTWALGLRQRWLRRREGRTSPGVINLSPLIFLVSCRPLSLSLILPVSFLCPIIHSLVFFLFFFPFLLLASVSGAKPVAVTCLCWWEYLSWPSVTVWCLGTLTSSPGSSSPSGLWGERPGCEPSTPTSVSPSAVDTADTHVHMHKNTRILFFLCLLFLYVIKPPPTTLWLAGYEKYLWHILQMFFLYLVVFSLNLLHFF